MHLVDFDENLSNNIIKKPQNGDSFSTIGLGKQMEPIQMKMIFDSWCKIPKLKMWGIKHNSDEIGYIIFSKINNWTELDFCIFDEKDKEIGINAISEALVMFFKLFHTDKITITISTRNRKMIEFMEGNSFGFMIWVDNKYTAYYRLTYDDFQHVQENKYYQAQQSLSNYVFKDNTFKLSNETP